MRRLHIAVPAIGLAIVRHDLTAQTLQTAPVAPPEGCAIVQVFGDASVRNVISEPGEKASTTGLLGLRYYGQSWIAVGSLSIAGRADTIRRGHGATLLPPAAGRALNAGLVDVRKRSLPYLDAWPYTKRLGFHLYGSAASSVWGFPDPARTDAFEVPVWGAGYSLYYQFFRGMINDTNSVSMALEVGRAHRHLRGDLFSPGRDGGVTARRLAVRDTLIGTPKRNFRGWEFGLTLNYRDLHGGITYYYFPAKQGMGIDGLTGGQVVAGISIQPTIASDWLKSGPFGRKPKTVGAIAAAQSRSADDCGKLAREARPGFVAPPPATDTTQRADSAARQDTTEISNESPPTLPPDAQPTSKPVWAVRRELARDTAMRTGERANHQPPHLRPLLTRFRTSALNAGIRIQ